MADLDGVIRSIPRMFQSPALILNNVFVHYYCHGRAFAVMALNASLNNSMEFVE
jgi:hypothetical protein